MAFEAKALFGECAFPVQAEANPGSVFQQSGGFFLTSEFGELFVKWMFRRQKGFLAVKDRRIDALSVAIAADFAGDEINDDSFLQSGMRILFEIWIGEERDLR